MKFYPYKSGGVGGGGGGELSHASGGGGTTSFEVVFNREHEVLPILKGAAI